VIKNGDVDIYRNAASIDHLTGLLNRRAFMEYQQHYRLAAFGLEGAQDADILPILIIFKLINDCFGHATGDEMLRLVHVRRTNSARPRGQLQRLVYHPRASIRGW
jgi:diguanylate cyclase (GGDEF)-like protein